MPTLLEKIEADAAKRLTLPPNRLPSQELARYKNFLKIESHRLKFLHRAGAGGWVICQGRAATMDVLLRYLLAAVKSGVHGSNSMPLALVALGGYGRNELNPHSDVDLMFLHGDRYRVQGRAGLQALAEGLLYPLYDIGLKVGHSVRCIDDCVKVANQDMQSKTALIEARLIDGDAGLFQAMQDAVRARCVEGYEDEYIAARLSDQEARHAKYGDSACMQEPNIKNGCGGLRDYQNLLWMAYFKYRLKSPSELQGHELLSETERRQLGTAYDFLLRLRNDLHYQVNRPLDVLLKELQPTLALNLGYTDRSSIKRIERFMGAVYLHLRNVYLITRTLERRLALLPTPNRRSRLHQFILGRRKPAPPQLFDGFQITEGEILPGSTRVFRDQPRRFMRVFLHAQQRGLKLHPDLSQLIRNQLDLVDPAFLRDPHVKETFLAILNQRGNVAPILRSMHEVGLLGRYLPEFGKLTCLVQHEFLHRYTADEHTLICLEMLDRVWAAERPFFNHYTEILQEIERPFVLYLALLLHDAGKATSHRPHAAQSAKLAVRVARRLGLDAQTTYTLRLLIENHLAMVQISQRRDLEDLAVARAFAEQVKTPENLDMLTLITFADSQATSMNLWNDFKETLLWSLYDQTAKVFLGEIGVAQAEEKQRDSVALAVRRAAPKTLRDDELEAHFNLLPLRYFQIHSPFEILSDLSLAHRFLQLQVTVEERALEPVLLWTNEPDRGYAAVRICTWDRAGLFSKIAGSLTATRLNILSAQIFSRCDGIIFDTFFVTDTRTGGLPSREIREQFEQLLKAVLTQPVDLASLIARLKVGRPPFPYLEGERIPTEIRFDNTVSDSRTLIEVETEDRVGLLFAISNALSELGLDISTAKICTEKGAAIDSFYVREHDGRQVRSADRLRSIETALRAAVVRLDAA
ncbi:MAG: [protein-PII] uridylyltransferase [Candidatus Omnitrophica bacterium]|nr:[protein-PII] uridylyltransferase [Candidatus Omnitrophota bacterium]